MTGFTLLATEAIAIAAFNAFFIVTAIIGGIIMRFVAVIVFFLIPNRWILRSKDITNKQLSCN